MKMNKVLYLAEFKYGKGNLVSFESDRETDKNYMVVDGSKKEILPQSYIWFSSRISKEKNVFNTEQEAIEYLADCASNHVRALSTELSKARSHADWLAKMRGE